MEECNLVHLSVLGKKRFSIYGIVSQLPEFQFVFIARNFLKRYENLKKSSFLWQFPLPKLPNFNYIKLPNLTLEEVLTSASQ